MYRYEIVGGFFQQDDLTVDPVGFDYVSKHMGVCSSSAEASPCTTRDFGLIAASHKTTLTTPWTRFKEALHDLNVNAPPSATYHFILLGRHGQGWHNVGEAKYGTKAWDDHFSKLDSSEGMQFLDARLTETGRQQARLAHQTFTHALQTGLPAPERYFVSPLDRCLETSRITFEGLDLPSSHLFAPMVYEPPPQAHLPRLLTLPSHHPCPPTPSLILVSSQKSIREVFGEHTCDKRSTKTDIQARHPGRFLFEEDFAEDDPLWTADHRETDEEVDTRIRSFLDRLFASRPRERTWSWTVHSGVIASFLRVVGHRPFAVDTGAVIPVVLKVTEDTA
ncbi:Histidine phosphatase-like protein 5 [Elsinoe fawcettii]|nr:Histidine phosphatase-like protein 5 [Elsinoe fawcettii]